MTLRGFRWFSVHVISFKHVAGIDGHFESFCKLNLDYLQDQNNTLGSNAVGACVHALLSSDAPLPYGNVIVFVPSLCASNLPSRNHQGIDESRAKVKALIQEQ